MEGGRDSHQLFSYYYFHRFWFDKWFGWLGDALALQKKTGVWWDLNTCPVPAGVEAGRVVACIESALEKEMGHGCQVYIYAMGNLEYISSDLLEQISSSGIDLLHAPRRKFQSVSNQIKSIN